MRWPGTLWLLIAAAAFAAGCKSRSDLVEAELRVKDRQLREMRNDLDHSSALNEAFENSLREQRGSCPPRTSSASPIVREIQIGRGTSGIDEDRCPGDEGVLVVIVPLDVDKSAVKVGGNLRVTAMQITPEGLKVPLSTWDVSAGYLQRHWRSGLISTGYYVALPWQAVPTFERLRLIATFTTIDGAMFEAEKDIDLHLGAGRRPEHITAPVPPEATPGPGLLPPPTPVTPPGPLPPPVPEPKVPEPKVPGSALPPPVPASYSGPSLSWKPKINVKSAAELMRPIPGR